jgi:hypothetical protein
MEPIDIAEGYNIGFKARPFLMERESVRLFYIL